MLFVRILNRIARVKKFSYTQTYSISSQKAMKNINLSLNPIRNPDTHNALLKITYHELSIQLFGIPKNVNFCWNKLKYEYKYEQAQLVLGAAKAKQLSRLYK